MEWDFRYLQGKYGDAGAREKFEEICLALLMEEYPGQPVHTIRPSQGDGGIDVMIGDYSKPIHVFQCKYFLDRIGKSQKDQIQKSFRTARDNPDFTMEKWTLLIPQDLSQSEMSWWSKWKSEREAPDLTIDYLGQKELIAKLRKHALYDIYFDASSKSNSSMNEKSIAGNISKTIQQDNKQEAKHPLILDKKQIRDLESSVGNYTKTRYAQSDEIFIQASKYFIDNDKLFRQVIVWNFRKGVKYNYLIPKSKPSQYLFRETVIGWYGLFASILESKDSYAKFFKDISDQELTTTYEFSKYWSKEYDDIVKSAKMIWENKSCKGQQNDLMFARKKCIDVFLSNLNIFTSDSYDKNLTVARYEIKDSIGNYRQWKGIMKTTSTGPETEYSAKVLEESSNSDDATYINEFKAHFYDKAALKRGNRFKKTLRNELYKRYGIKLRSPNLFRQKG